MNVLFVGGAACGKSYFAEEMISELSKPLHYIATMRPFGQDGAEKVAKHRKMREGKDFIVHERYTDLAGLRIDGGGTVLLECITNLIANEMFDGEGAGPEHAVEAAVAGVHSLMGQCDNLLIVTNEVGSELPRYLGETDEYIEVLGKANILVAQLCDRVYEMVHTRPVLIKDNLPDEPRWKGVAL